MKLRKQPIPSPPTIASIARQSRYDGLASWYDEAFAWYPTAEGGPGEQVRRLLGEGRGLVLDLGCGSGLSAVALTAAGWTVGGLDESEDQLSLAKSRCSWVVRGDLTALPFADNSIPRAALVLVHTDVDDYGDVVAEVVRVVEPGGTVAHVGVHPCFVGHHVESVTRSEERLTLVSGYGNGEWVFGHENFGPGVRGRIGARHVPLADLLNAFTRWGLVLEQVTEAGPHLVPWILSMRFTKLPRRQP